jgi:hypothetical protein
MLDDIINGLRASQWGRGIYGIRGETRMNVMLCPRFSVYSACSVSIG